MADLPSSDPYLARRGTVQGYLREHSAELGGIYALGSDLLKDRRPPGWAHMAAHAGRELMNRAADHLAEIPLEDSAHERGPDHENIWRQLKEALAGDGLRETVERLVGELARGGGETERRAAALLARAQAGEEFDEATTAAWVRAWRDLHRRFVQAAHLRTPSAPPVSEDELAQAWRELTDLLATRVVLEPFFDSLDELVELARTPNPDAELARTALARLRPGTKARFYAALSDPQWIDHLASANMFAHPPAAVRQEGTIRFPDWPEGLVLVRFAGTAPEAIAAAAATVPESDNSRVAQLIAATAAELPPDIATESGLAARVVRDLRGSSQLLDVAEPAAKLAQRLASSNRVSKALDILKALLSLEYFTTPSGSDFLPDWQSARYRHDEYLVDENARAMLDDLVAADAKKTVKTLTCLLVSAQQRLAYEDSTQWRDDIRGTRSPFGNDVRHLLLELLRDACAVLAARGADERRWVLENLQNQGSAIFQRLMLHLLSELPDEAARRHAAVSDPAVLFSRRQIPEVYRLLPVAFGEMEPAEQANLLSLINAGPSPEPWMLTDEEGRDPEDESKVWQDEWRQRLLSALEPLLGTEEQAQLEDLRARRGRLDRPDFGGIRSTSWVGPIAPATAADLVGMDKEGLLKLLREFRAERHFAAPSPEGLARELASAVEAEPARWIWLTEHFEEMPPHYVREWLAGLRAAIHAGAALPDAEQILATLEWIFEQPGDPDSQAAPLADDVDFYGSQCRAADLLIEILEHDQLSLDRREQLWELVIRLVENSDPTAEREAATDTEPFSFGLSSLRPRGVTAVIRYLQWLETRLPRGEGPGSLGFDAAPEAQGVLGQLIDRDPSAAVKATLAVEFPVLAILDSDWLAARVNAVADPKGDELARVGWSAYIQYAQVYGDATVLLADAYRHAVAMLAGAPPDMDELRRQLAEHLAIIWRDLPETVPGIFDEFLAVAPAADHARAMGFLGRALRPRTAGEAGYRPTDEDLDRHRALWDGRLAAEPGSLEIQEFGWWWTSGRFRGVEDVRRLAETLRITHGELGDPRGSVKLLAKLVSEDAGLTEGALEVLDVLAETRTAQRQYIQPEALQAILESGLAEARLRENATSLIHSFGEQGYLTLRSVLD